MITGRLLDSDSGREMLSVVFRTTSAFERMRGLLGRKALARSEGLLIDPCGSVHTAFMPYALDIVYLDGQGEVLKIVERVAPWRMSACRRARMTLELAGGAAKDHELQAGMRLEWQS